MSVARLRALFSRLLFAAAALAMAGLCVPMLTFAQGYPTRPITLVYPYPSGAALENLLRQLDIEASNRLGQPIVFENRPGANTRLGINAIHQAPPDGYVITFATDSILVHQPLVDPTFKLEEGKDYTPIIFLTRNLLVLAARPGLPFKDIKGMVAYAKANPGKLNIGFGSGSPLHFGAELLRQSAGIDLAMIPYKGTPDALAGLLGGQVDLELGSATYKPQIDSGKFIALATSGKERWDLFPNVPTLMESGIPMQQSTWSGFIAPAGTSNEVVTRLYGAYIAAFKVPEIARHFQEQAFIPDTSMSTQDFAALIKSDTELWTPVIRKSGIKMQ